MAPYFIALYLIRCILCHCTLCRRSLCICIWCHCIWCHGIWCQRISLIRRPPKACLLLMINRFGALLVNRNVVICYIGAKPPSRFFTPSRGLSGSLGVSRRVLAGILYPAKFNHFRPSSKTLLICRREAQNGPSSPSVRPTRIFPQ